MLIKDIVYIVALKCRNNEEGFLLDKYGYLTNNIREADKFKTKLGAEELISTLDDPDEYTAERLMITYDFKIGGKE